MPLAFEPRGTLKGNNCRFRRGVGSSADAPVVYPRQRIRERPRTHALVVQLLPELHRVIQEAIVRGRVLALVVFRARNTAQVGQNNLRFLKNPAICG